MKCLRDHLNDYLELRRQLGFKLREEGYLLRDFVRFARQQRQRFITTNIALRWAMLPNNVTQGYRARRIGVVRAFAAHLSTIEPRTEVPAQKLIPCRVRRRDPYHYSDEELPRLLAAAHQLDTSQGIRGRTFSTLLGLLAVTGMRVGEALALDKHDVDLEADLLTIRQGKGNKSRLVPLHASTAQALHRYVTVRDRVHPTSSSFFVWEGGGRVKYATVENWFVEAACRVGLRRTTAGRGGPRLHDLRHYFAIRTLLNWYQCDADVDALLPGLATFLGHANISDTYWYLSAVPELLALATRRWERVQKGGK